MIQSGSYLNVVDNSGGKTIFCIKVGKGYRRRYARVGDIITASIKELRKKNRATSKVKKGDVVKALIIRTRSIIKTKKKEYINFYENSAVLLTKQNKLIGTRIFGSIPKQFKFSRFVRVASLCAGFIK